MLQCKNCNRIIMDTSDNGWKIRTRMLLFRPDSITVAICPSCKAEVPVPVAILADTLASEVKNC